MQPPATPPAGRPAAPDPWLTGCAPALHPGGGMVLDLACGDGRNTLWLARRGLDALGVDASEERIAAARNRALAGPAAARFEVRTVTAGLFPHGPWDGICVCHFLDRELFAAIAEALAPGGWLAYKTHLSHPHRDPHRRPRNPEYLLRSGELLGAFRDLVPLRYDEWLESGGGYAALLARRTGAGYSS